MTNTENKMWLKLKTSIYSCTSITSKEEHPNILKITVEKQTSLNVMYLVCSFSDIYRSPQWWAWKIFSDSAFHFLVHAKSFFHYSAAVSFFIWWPYTYSEEDGVDGFLQSLDNLRLLLFELLQNGWNHLQIHTQLSFSGHQWFSINGLIL